MSAGSVDYSKNKEYLFMKAFSICFLLFYVSPVQPMEQKSDDRKLRRTKQVAIDTAALEEIEAFDPETTARILSDLLLESDDEQQFRRIFKKILVNGTQPRIYHDLHDQRDMCLRLLSTKHCHDISPSFAGASADRQNGEEHE